MPIPRGRRIILSRIPSRVYPPPVQAPDVDFNDASPMNFDQENPKRPGTKSHELYEQSKSAKTAGEAIAQGATKEHLRYDISKGFARVQAVLVCYALAAMCRSPLLEAFCSEHSMLGVVGERLGREVLRYTESKDLADEHHVSEALRALRERPGAHIHGSLPCTPWASWQRLNLKKGKPKVVQRILRARELSLLYVCNFERLGKAVLAKGGSVSFEWPRHCDGWAVPQVRAMIAALGLQPVDIDGCSVGVQGKEGAPMLKPWRFLVSSPHLAGALRGLRYTQDHEHRKIAGGRLTASTAFYPEELCRVVHAGLDQHERG